MAILQEGTVLAGIRGKIGNIVIYQWKNKICARSKPAKARKKSPRTTAQQAQNNKMKVLSPFLIPLKNFSGLVLSRSLMNGILQQTMLPNP